MAIVRERASPVGGMSTREQKVARARELRAEGLTYREIGERMGVPLKTAASWILDPYLRARRVRYSQPCPECGQPMDGSGGYKKPRTLCIECRTWTREDIIAAIQRWADEHGGLPPREVDWRHALPGYPSYMVLVRRFGWNAMLLEAGYGLRCDRRPETQAWIEEQLRAGVSVEEIADAIGVTPHAIGVTPQAIGQRMRIRGLRISDLRPRVAA